MPGGFEKKPATKGDIAELQEEVIPKLDALEERLEGIEGRVGHIETYMATKKDMENLATSADLQANFNRLFELLKGPEGFAERLERVEKHVGLIV